MIKAIYTKTILLFFALTIMPSVNAKNTTFLSKFFTKNIYQLTSILLENKQSLVMPEICDNGIDDDGDGLIDCFDPDCSNTCITGEVSRSFISASTNYGFFSYDPDPACTSADWEDDWTKFNAPEGFSMVEYDDGSFIMSGTLVNNTDSNDSWEVWIRLHNKRTWTEWSALGRSYYEANGGGNCSANHVDWDFYETDASASRWLGTPGSVNDGKIVTISHGPTDFSKGVQVGFGASNCTTCNCTSFNVRGWYKMSGDLDLPCGDYGSVLSGYEKANDCNVYNGDFEEGINYWNAGNGVTTTTDAASGNLAGVITGDNSTLTQLLLPASPNTSYVANIWSKVAGSPSDAVLVMEFYDGNINSLAKYTTSVTSTTYQQYILGGIAPDNAAYVSIWGWKETGGSFYLDELCLEISEDYTESTCQDILNSGFEDGVDMEWSTWGTVTTTSSAYAGGFAALIYGSDGGLEQAFNIVPGTNYNFEVYIRETNIDDWTAFGLSWLDASDNIIYDVKQVNFTGTYQKYSIQTKAPSNAVKARVWVTKIGNGEVYIDNNCFKVFERIIPTENCGNGVDDDNDGLIDNYDEDCCPNLSIIPQSNYSLHYVDSEESGFGEATKAFDGDTETYWHTDFDNTTYPLPHEIQIDLGNVYKVGGFRYLPIRSFEDGRIENYEVYVSKDPNNWGTPVATGTIVYTDLGDKEISFPLTEGRYFRLVVLTEASNNGFATAVEINILECKGQEICDDGEDNDGDGLIDCEDPDCSADVSLSVTSTTNCGENITVSANRCINYAGVVATTNGNVTDANATIEAPDGTAALLNRVSDNTYTRLVWDFGAIIPAGEEVCFRVRNSSATVPAMLTIWLLNAGLPTNGAYSVVSTKSFVGVDWQDLCFIMPRASRYVKITDDGGASFYVDAVGRKCRDIDGLTYSWNTGETGSSISVNGAATATYTVEVTSPGGCVATSNIEVTGLNGCPEICGNGLDDDGDGFIDAGDTDCTTDCDESLLFVARDYGEIVQVNLMTGTSSIAGVSPYTNGNLNAMAANPDAEIVYYGSGKTVYYWNPNTGVHGILINLDGQVGNNESLTSGGAAYFNNHLYLGFEDDLYLDYPTIYQLPLAADGLSTTGGATNLHVPIPNNTSWGDMIVTLEGETRVIYAGLGYNGDINSSLYFKYEIEGSTYTTIRTDMPLALQIGVDVDGNLWGGALESGTIQKMDKTTGNFFGTPIYIGGDMWDLTGPINCPQQIEICNNGQDDDGDGRIDSDDDDCDCPTIATTDPRNISICVGDNVTFTVMTDASNPPFDEVEFYRFTTRQSNPYLTNMASDRIGRFDNDTGMGSIISNDFPLNNSSSATYYVYAMLKDEPSDLTDCLPFIEYVINIDPCAEIEINCIEGRAIETFYTGIKDIPTRTLSFGSTTDIDSVIVQIIYENFSPGNSITIQDASGNNYNLNREIKGDIHRYEKTIPTTGSITYSNGNNLSDAQSIVAYVYKSNQPGGAFARYNVGVSGHANTRTLGFALPDRTEEVDMTLRLPVSELTYDDRILTFNITAGSYTQSFTRTWGPSGDDFPKECCVDLLEIELPNIAASVEEIEVEIHSPGMRGGQSYIIAGTVFLEINCFEDEDCTDGVDNDNDGAIDQADLDCSGYCSNNNTFLSYGMLALETASNGVDFYSAQYGLTFQLTDQIFLYWNSGNEFYIKGTVIAYKDGNYVGKYTLIYTATGVTYSTFGGDDILGSTGGSGRLISQEPNLTLNDEILMGTKLNGNGWGMIVRGYDTNDIRVEGDWSLSNWTTMNTFNASVITTDCQEPREICGNGEDDDNDGLADCEDPDCENPNDSGTITGNESNCGVYSPSRITEQIAPTGIGTGVVDYQWEANVSGNIWNEIQGAISATYTPPVISQTTRYRRKLRAGICNPWLISNVVTKTVTPSPFDALIINVPGGPTGYLCAEASYTFEAEAVADAIYTWEFGEFANPSTAVGIGPHNVVFDIPSDDTPISSEVILSVIGTTNLCVATDTAQFNIHPLSEVLSVDSQDPSLCGASDGWITLTTGGETDVCIEVSLDGGVNYYPEGQTSFTGLSSGSYQVFTRYCDNSCPNIAEIITLSDPATINLSNDDFANVCPGFSYTHNVLINDDIRGEVVVSLATNSNFGNVVLEENGDFVYTSNTPTCEMDQFAYTVCDRSMNCCVTAVATIDFNDQEAPTLVNVPEDLTVNCDDEIPLPPLVSAFDNCPAISIDKDEKSTQGEEGCALYDYTITYTWTAQDFCGNEAVDSQLIFVKDVTAPDIYRIYTLPNGKHLVAGVMENVTHRWKSVQLPIEFATTPLVFSQLVTTNEPTPAIVRMRNVSEKQFEIRLQEEEGLRGERLGESVAWFAIEEGTQITDYQLEAAKATVGGTSENINFQQGFTKTPALFTTMQTILDNDPAYPRNNNLSSTGVSVNIQEEKSVNNDDAHAPESLAYLAIDTTILLNKRGDVFGETGKLSIDNNWATVTLKNTYVNPIVIANSLSQNEQDPAIVQVDNVTRTSFTVRIKEWTYLDDLHQLEDISYIVIEGSVPLNGDRFCEFGTDSLVQGVDLVAVDNCDQNVSIIYEETESYSGPKQIFTRVWSAVDDCGNKTIYSQDVTCEGVYLRLKAVLQGASIYSNDGMMRDDLRRKGLIPLTEPYSANTNYEHIGEGGGETMDHSMMNETGPDACVDWVFIELCDGNDVNTVVATVSGIIQKDGDVMTAQGDTLIRFENVRPGDYYVALSHRNHLRTVSLFPYTFTPNGIPFVDFTSETTPVIGIEPNIDLEGGRALWSGDINGDDKVIYQGPGNDVFNMFLHVILDSLNNSFLTNFISSDYTDNDFNMDGTVIFQGPNNDKSTMLFNTVLRHPNNSANFSNFVISTHAVAQIQNGNNPEGTIPGFDFDKDGIPDGLDPDDDNDGVADGNDVDPMNPDSDSDGDSISDDIETGGDGQYHLGIDTDPLNPCDPAVSANCTGIDTDRDGYFRNYPTDHTLYDAYDNNACLPDGANSACSCRDEDNDGYIYICHKDVDGNNQTKRIPLSTLPFHLEHGDTCGPCN